MAQIQFLKSGHDEFLDFIKAYAIIGVIFGHTWLFMSKTPGLGLFFGVDVPLFLLIQVFHFYKKDSKLNLTKVFSRVFLPYFIVQAILFLYVIFLNGFNYSVLLGGVIMFGFGPGSYYPLIYIQIAVSLVIFKNLFKRISKGWLFFIFLLLSEGLEILCSYTNPPNWLFRILAFRYVFLIYLGYLWVKDGIVIDAKMIVLAILSAATVIYFVYFQRENEPWFFNTAWKYSRWPCYYWVSNGLITILWFLWKVLKKSKFFCKCVCTLAKTSWEIFLMQMASIYVIKQSMLPIDNKVMQYVLYMIIIWTISIGGGIILNKLWSNLLYGRKNVQKSN